MPIYEFYCEDCHTIFNFLSRKVDTDRRPSCPRCGRPDLDRQVSMFSVSKGQKEGSEADVPDLDEDRLQKAMASLAGEMAGINENDPRQMARFMRKLTEASGMKLDGGMEEAIRRLEAGEDPEKLEETMGDFFEAENPLAGEKIKGLRRKYTHPAHDETLYSF